MARILIISFLILSSLTPSWAGQGWYMMRPPFESFESENKNKVYPLYKWNQVKAFDSAKECEGEREKLKKNNPKIGIDSLPCIASDDPRLNPTKDNDPLGIR
ncbi:MAG: hypothetical protein ACYDBV_10815 [Nitrospiria bacterium]